MTSAQGVLRIGELSRRTGVSVELLRAWERRYGLVSPSRSAGGLRLYSLDDVERVRTMRDHLTSGLAAAEAARLATESSRTVPSETTEQPALPIAALLSELTRALDDYDEPRAHAVLDRVLAGASIATVIVDVLLPYLHELGDRWERGEVSVAQEHFASGVLRGRLLGLARGWGAGTGPHALLACAPGEEHELGLIAFGLCLRSRGWRISYLGADNPIDTISSAADSLGPDVVVISAVAAERLVHVAGDLRTLATHHRLALGGSAATTDLAERAGARALLADPVSAAEGLTTLLSEEPRP